MDKTPLCKRLKQARVEKNISQKKLGLMARIEECSASARMNQYETGKHAPNYSSLKRIAEVLNVPPAYFYAEEDELAELIRLYQKLNKKQAKETLEHIRKKYTLS